MRTLKVTSPPEHGPDVVSLQQTMRRKGFPVTVDGVYGPATGKQVVAAKRVLHYPSARQLPIAGPLFRHLLGRLADKPGLILLRTFKPTHDTAGLPGFPAIDLMTAPGTLVGAPERVRLVHRHMIAWSLAERVGGWTCFLHGLDSGNTYFVTHFATLAGEGTYANEQLIGTVAAVPYGWWQSHIHEGLHRGYFPI